LICQLTIDLQEGKIVEYYKLEEKEKEWTTTREISGTVMTSVSA
jgi:hypothetical protein